MIGQFLAASFMFFITVGFASLFRLPAVKFVQKSQLLNFYWVGFWAFLGGLTALAGAQSVLIILGQDVQRFATAMLFGVTASFICFVMFAWGRLTFVGLRKGIKIVISKSE